ncbi:MAG: SDR family oxidoreductase [Herpetosiphonaceae bacterium]|nr:SDR family oxidoreductase [Herpetosiphonaceae bacterium]
MESSVIGEVALITGAGQGIGRAIALRLAQDGMDVVIVDRQGDQAESVAAEVQSRSCRALALTVDVTVAAQRQQMLDTTLGTFGRLDVVVNNAAIQCAALPRDVTEEHWDALMNVNAKAVFFCCQLALQHMAEQRSGRIVNMASIAGKLASTIYHPIYNVSKAAVIAMTKTLALAYASDGIRINAVCPGVVDTPMQAVVDREFARVTGRPAAEIRAERVGRIPMGRIEQPEEVAAMVSFLVGPDAGYITGEAFNVSGGMLAG